MEIDAGRLTKVGGNYIYNSAGLDLKTTKLKFRGVNNVLILGDGVQVKNSVFDFRADNSVVYIESSALRANLFMGQDVTISVGQGTTFTNTCNITAAEGYDIAIGKNCMVAEDVYITNTDGHPIFDQDGDRVNRGKGIYIGDHVWIGRGAEILKGVEVHSGSVIGAKSIVTKSVPSNSVSVGNPNRLIRSGISFGRYTTLTLPEESYQKIDPPELYSVGDLGCVEMLTFARRLKDKILGAKLIR
jgi:acetyltransferase-like isoleucine patch superfamily enzyme